MLFAPIWNNISDFFYHSNETKSQNRKQQRLQQKRYNANSRSLSTNSNAEGIPNSATSNGVNDSFEGDTEIDMIEDGGSSSSAVISEQVRSDYFAL